QLPYVWNVISPFYFEYHPLGIPQDQLCEIRQNARIIHFNGRSKPWHYSTAIRAVAITGNIWHSRNGAITRRQTEICKLGNKACWLLHTGTHADAAQIVTE